MPAHLGLKEKLQIGWAFVGVNLGQTQVAKNARKARVVRERIRRGNHEETNRKQYVSMKYITGRFEINVRRREDEPADTYEIFRQGLNLYNPAHGQGRYSDQNEWNLYLAPGTNFDRTCEEAFAKHFDTGFKMMLITHKSDTNKLKRIEAIFGSGKVEILWTDAF